jgi:hypothetical protein
MGRATADLYHIFDIPVFVLHSDSLYAPSPASVLFQYGNGAFSLVEDLNKPPLLSKKRLRERGSGTNLHAQAIVPQNFIRSKGRPNFPCNPLSGVEGIRPTGKEPLSILKISREGLQADQADCTEGGLQD